MKLPRLSGTIGITIALLIAVVLLAPQQLPVTLYKLSLLSVAGLTGYWLDRALFPYARPNIYLQHPHYHLANEKCDDSDVPVVNEYRLLMAAAMIRRAIIVGCSMLAVGLGA